MRHAICAITVATALCVPASTAFGAADTGAKSNPSCMGLFSSVDAIRGDASRADAAQVAAHSGVNPGLMYHLFIGGPGEHC
jgi:hypothetical protein